MSDLVYARRVRSDMDNEIRLRWRAWLAHFRAERLRSNPSETQAGFAAWLGVSQPTIHLALKASGARGPGIDVAVLLSEATGVSLDTITKKYPHEVYPQHKERSGERAPNPSEASPGAAHPGRRGGGGRV
jgi:hypothetical protein